MFEVGASEHRLECGTVGDGDDARRESNIEIQSPEKENEDRCSVDGRIELVRDAWKGHDLNAVLLWSRRGTIRGARSREIWNEVRTPCQVGE